LDKPESHRLDYTPLAGRTTGIEQNRCAMACQGCGIAIFCFL
jgi:hypothetical protein